MATTKKLMGTTAAAGGVAELLAIEDVFSTYLYTGTSAAQTITNGIDLAGEGGMVWLKSRSNASHHFVVDTERGNNKYILTNATSAELTSPAGSDITSFNSDGFSFGNYNYNINFNNYTYASWTFRKAPRFFDVVTYTGDGVAGRQIAHSLGQSVGACIIKRTDSTGDWPVWHRSGGYNGSSHLHGSLNYPDVFDNYGYFNTSLDQSTYFTSTYFTVQSHASVNTSGATYVAYLFAHDPLGPSGDGSDGLIACGSYTGNGSTTGPEIDLGWEPQWVMVKNASGSGGWQMYDSMREFSVTNSKILQANLSDAEFSASYFVPTSTGFKCVTTSPALNTSGSTYIYIAIRRGPMRQPTSGTEVFATVKDPVNPNISSSILVDTQFIKNYSNASGQGWFWHDRLRQGSGRLDSSTTDSESSGSLYNYFDFTFGQTGTVNVGGGFGDPGYIAYQLRRAPGFFDVVAYTGDGVAGRTVPHNLGVAPEMIIVKTRDSGNKWIVGHSGLNVNGDGLPWTDFMSLNETSAAADQILYWNDTPPASDVFTIGSGNFINGSSNTYIAYLFATLPGVSKVGSYTGNGGTGDINVDCGFTSGARFVLIKDATSANDWYVWDTARGIVAGNDPYLRLNSTGAETTDSDWVDPYSAGFTVTTGLYANLRINVFGNTYIFLAIA